MSKKAASPIVLISAANTAPKETIPLVNKLITIIAPPHPGIAPKKEHIGISKRLLFKINFWRLKFFFSKKVKIRSVIPTNDETAIKASLDEFTKISLVLSFIKRRRIQMKRNIFESLKY
jgi:hypothetical protein|tara:strand:+ start:1380 stop:1736 length:357 start_codon:yes stop_codon:yes gene_type:complete